MRALTTREKWLLGLCFGVIFLVANGFAARSVLKVLHGSGKRIGTLRNELADYEMWLDDAAKADARLRWLDKSLPTLDETTLGKEQGDLLQALQDDLFDRKLRIDRQSLQDIVYDTFYTEISVRLEVEGEESAVLEWLTTLQSPEKFLVIKSLELELDNRSREPLPQAECEITIARWYRPNDSDPLTSKPKDETLDHQG